MDEPFVWYEGATLSTKRWLHPDERGSIVAWSDAAALATVYRYGAYGEPAANDYSGSRFRYTGQIALPEVKLYHYKARAYDPALGRFLQTDPVGYQDDFNLYAYVYNDPLNKSDPNGREAACANAPSKCDYGFGTKEAKEVASLVPGAGLEVSGGKYLKMAGRLLGKLGRTIGDKATQSVTKFLQKSKAAAKAGTDVKSLPNEGVAVQATLPGRVEGSKAVYEKQIDSAGNTVQYTKTTFDPQGDIADVHDFVTGEKFYPDN